MFEEMQAEESGHRQALFDLYRQKFGEHIPLIRRQDVKGFIERRPEWLVRPLGIQNVRKQAEVMELETRRFYERAISHVTDASIRKLLGDLAEVERQHYAKAESLERAAGDHRRAWRGRKGEPANVHAADYSAGACGLDGRLGFDAGADFCGGARDA